MLKRLFVSNVLFIKQIDVEFDYNLAVITGETGSGKSVLLECIGFALGEKLPNNFSINDQTATIVLEFDIANNILVQNLLAENSISFEDYKLSIRRTMSVDKKSKNFINDIPVSSNLIKELSSSLLEYQGQHSQTVLLDAKQHGYLLDQYANITSRVNNLGKTYTEILHTRNLISTFEKEASLKEAEIDYLKHIVTELDSINIKENEAETLADQRILLLTKRKIAESIENAISIFEDSKIESALLNIYKILSKVNDDDSLKLLDEILAQLDEFKNLLLNKQPNNYDETELGIIEDRFFMLNALAKKHRCQSFELNKFLEDAKTKLIDLEQISHNVEIKQKYLNELTQQYQKEAIKISEERKLFAKILEEKLQAELKQLKLEQTSFKINIETNLDKISANGIDRIEFLISTNPGMNLSPLKDIASGGELSRFMLSLRVVLLNIKSPPTIIFDEIDVGLGGAVADAVGDKLLLLSKEYQIIVITHHPQVAAKAEEHFKIAKSYNSNNTNMEVSKLNLEGKKNELARMISGKNITNESLIAASRLLQDA